MRLRALLMFPLVACTSHDLPAEAGTSADASANDATLCAFCSDAAYVYDAPGPTPPDAFPPPQVDCSDGGACPLPRSVCVDDQWLEYFDNGLCEDGGCSFDVKMTMCGQGLCFDGGCQLPHLTAPAPM